MLTTKNKPKTVSSTRVVTDDDIQTSMPVFVQGHLTLQTVPSCMERILGTLLHVKCVTTTHQQRCPMEKVLTP